MDGWNTTFRLGGLFSGATLVQGGYIWLYCFSQNPSDLQACGLSIFALHLNTQILHPGATERYKKWKTWTIEVEGDWHPEVKIQMISVYLHTNIAMPQMAPKPLATSFLVIYLELPTPLKKGRKLKGK